jgi:Flp pilus assembly protein TadB
MNTAAWTGLVLGALIGAVCGFWQARDMRTEPGLKRAGSSALRLAFLLAALLASVAWAGADKLWLVGSVAVVYTAVFLWKFKQALTKKK